MTTRIFNFVDGFTSSSAPTEDGAFTVTDTQFLADSGLIALQGVPNEVVKVAGGSGAVTLSSTPFVSAPSDGAEIVVMGLHPANTVTLTHNDAAGGCILNGDATLGEYDELTLIYDLNLDRYIEKNRNF